MSTLSKNIAITKIISIELSINKLVSEVNKNTIKVNKIACRIN